MIRSGRDRCHARRRPICERLESRNLLACDVALTGSVIEITGTDYTDTVEITSAPFNSPGPGVSVNIDMTCGGDFQSQSGKYTELRFTGKAGDDTLENNTPLPITADGGPGKDFLKGGSGDDRLSGGDGRDRIEGGGGSDQLDGGGELDELVGGAGNDILRGGAGDDVLEGGLDHDVLWGGPGNDSLYGGPGMDTLYGESGNDGLYGGQHNDSLFGGPDADRFLTDDESPDGVYSFNEEVDAWIYFADGEGGKFDKTSGFDPGSWTATEIERVDVALRTIHRVSRDTHLLKKKDGSMATFTRYGAAWGSGAAQTTPAWNSGGNVWFTNGAFSNMLDHYVYHEIGHTFDDPAFRKLSYWTPWNQNYLPPDFVWATPVNGNQAKWIYHESALFAENYGKTHPFEDFATAFAALFVDAAGQTFLPGPGAWAIPKKIDWLYEHVVKA